MENTKDIFPKEIQTFLNMGMSIDSAYQILLADYERICAPNKTLLADYTRRAKGPNRSLRQFAEEIGVNVSTLSRLMNQKISGVNSSGLIAKIAAHKDENCGIDFDMFMKALGMKKIGETIGDEEKRIIKSKVKECIFSELLDRQYSVGLIKNEIIDTLAGSFSFDFAIETNAWGELGLWGFTVETDYHSSTCQTSNEFESNVKRIMRKISYLSSLYEMFGFSYNKISLIMTDDDLFYAVKQMIHDMPNLYLIHEVSLILINLENEKLSQEYVIQHIAPNGEQERKDVFTDVEYDSNTERKIVNAWNSMYDE